MTNSPANGRARADGRPQAAGRANWPQSLAHAIAYALIALLALSHAGCVSKPTKQPSTVQEFLKQPRPQ
ncbi:MAG TPA: hypothetical protein VG125_22255 [Pirellulales bacterium]|jgi:hypothetical protein|nr:hypothetical protein [Pirellulales bacterium]